MADNMCLAGPAPGGEPTPDDVKKCTSDGAPPPRRPSKFQRCLHRDQIADDEVFRDPDTFWIQGGRTPGANHYRTTNDDHYPMPGPGQCPEKGARRFKSMWHFLVQKMTEAVWGELKKPPEIAPYITHYRETFNDDDFTPQPEAALKEFGVLPNELDAKYPLYTDPPCSYWRHKQMYPPRLSSFDNVTPVHEIVHPFRRNAVFTTPIRETLYDPPDEAPHIKEPRTREQLNHLMLAPVQTPVQPPA